MPQVWPPFDAPRPRCDRCDRLSYLSPAGFCLECQTDIDKRREIRENTAHRSPGPGVGVLLVWTGRLETVRDALAPVLSGLYARGIVTDHPDGASEGWEWKG